MQKSLFDIKKETNYLFFDTETTGLPKNWSSPVSDLENWPRLVQLAWVLCDQDSKVINQGSYIIKPEGFLIPAESVKIHGITTARAQKEGVAVEKALKDFKKLIDEANYLVGHNISFDEKIIGAEFLRIGIFDSTVLKEKICTKEIATNFCAIPAVNAFSPYKWPKLSELHYKLFGIDFTDAHNAVADVNATAKCFWELKRLKIF